MPLGKGDGVVFLAGNEAVASSNKYGTWFWFGGFDHDVEQREAVARDDAFRE